MKIAIIDDSSSCASRIQKEVEKYFPSVTTQVFLGEFDGIFKYSFDICFMDIMLGNMDGIELSLRYTKLYPNCKIVFITNYDNLVYDTLVTNLFFFIRKENMEEDMQRFYQKYIITLEEESKTLKIVSHRDKLSIAIKNILYIVVSRNHCYIHTIDNNCYEIYSSLTKIIKEIDSLKFCQINHHVVINIEHIKQVVGNKVLMNDNAEVGVGRRKRKELMEKYRDKLLNSN